MLSTKIIKYMVLILSLVFAFSLCFSGCFKIYPGGKEEVAMEEQPPEEHPEEHFEEPPPEEHPEEHFEEPPPEEPPGEHPPEEPQQQQQQQGQQQQQQQGQQQQGQQQQQTQQTQSGQGTNQWTTDVALTDIYQGNQPHGQFHVRITNNGPGTLNNVNANVMIEVGIFSKTSKSFLPTQFQVNLNSKPGETQTFPTGVSYDMNVYWYEVECTVDCGFNDPDLGNNWHKETFK